jgi:hypothetical protein
MPHYELDDYVQEHVPDDAVSANCAASWRACADAESSATDAPKPCAGFDPAASFQAMTVRLITDFPSLMPGGGHPIAMESE